MQQESSSVEPTSTGSPLARSISDKIVKCRELKDEGNKLFKAEDWKKAMKKYHHAFMYVKGITDKLDLLPGLEASLGRQRATEQEKKDATELMLSLLNNLSCELCTVCVGNFYIIANIFVLLMHKIINFHVIFFVHVVCCCAIKFANSFACIKV